MTGVYIHIPFCVKKCRYCDFISFDTRKEYINLYLEAMKKEFVTYKGICADTVFIGGGTPTCMEEYQLEMLLSEIRENFEICADAEFTVEANPKTLSRKKLELMKRYGVNRISIGVQSFNDKELLKIGRIHSAMEAEETVGLVRSLGFDNFNIDIMSALPEQNFESFKKTLKKTVDCNPAHISCYSLILEENTPLWRENEKYGLNLPDENTERYMYEYACKYLEEVGYRRYEISNFARPGAESKHNLKYWKCEEYIGLGLAAHSYFNGARYYNTNDLAAYLSGKYSAGEKEILTLKDKVEEFMIMGLRLRDGISKNEFKNRFGMDIDLVYHDEIEKFITGGFLKESNGNLFLSDKGVSVSNSIMCEFALCNLKIND